MIEKELGRLWRFLAAGPTPRGSRSFTSRRCTSYLLRAVGSVIQLAPILYTIGSIWIDLDLFAKPSSRFHPAMPVHSDLFGSISETRVYFYRWGQVTSDIPYTEKPEVSKNGLFRAIYK